MSDLNPIEVASGISEFGFLAITAAFYLVVTGVMMITIIRWAMKSINSITEKTNKATEEILNLIKKVDSSVFDIKEGINDELLTQIKILSNYAFNDAKADVIRELERVKKANNIDNREATERKIYLILENLHRNRNNNFHNFFYGGGRRLSEFTNHDWVKRIADVMLGELYNPDGYNSARAAANIHLAYEEIKVEFFNRLTK